MRTARHPVLLKATPHGNHQASPGLSVVDGVRVYFELPQQRRWTPPALALSRPIRTGKLDGCHAN